MLVGGDENFVTQILKVIASDAIHDEVFEGWNADVIFAWKEFFFGI